MFPNRDAEASTSRRLFGVLGAALVLAATASAPVSAAETRGYVVSWFYMATDSSDKACPQGINPRSEEIFRRILLEGGRQPAEIEKLMNDFPNTMYAFAGRRGTINGKPADVYLNPTSVPDPKLKTVQGADSVGFNIDGKETAEDFVDVQTGERGVDNQLYRALGCIGSLRGVGARPTHPSITWDMTRDQMPAWLIEISGIDDAKNDDDVTVSIFRAEEPIIRNAAAEPQADMTFRVDNNPRMNNRAKARIKNGVLVSEPFSFYMIGDPFSVPEYELDGARVRLDLSDPSGAKGVIGGFQKWETIYWSLASGGSVNEANVSIDIPGIYYALRKMADASPDPRTGQNMAISASYTIEAVPAFINHPSAQIAQAR